MSSEAIAAAIPRPLLNAVCSAFSDAQHHSSSHRKNVHTLLKHFEGCSKTAEGEQSFFLAILHCLHHCLAVRKNDELANRLMRFLVGIVVRVAALKTLASGRFVENILMYALDNIGARDRHVRSRLCQLVVAGVNAVEEVGDRVWRLFQGRMIERVYDKDAGVRVHAVHAMARLQGLSLVGHPNQSLAKHKDILGIFMDILNNDPYPEVRRAALTQIDVNNRSLPCILGRARDVDPHIRKHFYSVKMPEIDVLSLTIDQRDVVLKHGLADRDENVQRACVEMIFSHWLPRTNSNLIQFLTCLDVVSNAEVAETALCSFFRVIPKLFDVFPPTYFDHLTVETVFVLRVYVEWVAEQEKESGDQKIQELLPELSRLADCVGRFYQYFIALQDDEAARAEVEFILAQLMAVTGWLDAADEVGRRACLSVLDEMLVNMNISDSLFSACITLLFKLSDSLDDFVIRLVQLAADYRSVYDVQDIDDQVRIMAQLKAVAVVSALMRSSIDITLSRFSVLLTLLNELIIPAVNSQYSVVQAAGLECLGLYGLANRDLAEEYSGLFVEFFRVSSSADARYEAVRVLLDLLLVYGTGLEASIYDSILSASTRALYDPEVEVRAAAAEGFAKLLLHDKLENPEGVRDVLVGLLLLHWHPNQLSNNQSAERMCQCLSFFLHAYAFGSHEHQALLRGAVAPGLSAILSQSSSPVTAFSQLRYLCDPVNCFSSTSDNAFMKSPTWIEMATELLWGAIASHAKPILASRLCICATKIDPICVGPDDQSNLKELSWLCSLALHRLPLSDRTALSGLKRLASAIAVSDDGSATLSPGRLEELKTRAAGLFPNIFNLPMSNNQNPTLGQNAVKGGRRRVVNAENVLDNLHDMLE